MENKKAFSIPQSKKENQEYIGKYIRMEDIYGHTTLMGKLIDITPSGRFQLKPYVTKTPVKNDEIIRWEWKIEDKKVPFSVPPSWNYTYEEIDLKYMENYCEMLNKAIKEEAMKNPKGITLP